MSALSRLYTVQKLPAGRLSILPRPRGGDWLNDEIKALYFEGVAIVVSLLMPEEEAELDLRHEGEVCQSQGVSYRSYPILDHHVPPWSLATFKLLEDLQEELARGKHVAVHCRMGLGRSALIAASVLVLSGLTPEQACEMLSTARGYTVPETEEQRAWVKALPLRYQEKLHAQDDRL
ncbi:MAG TPA: protein-tyrosine phosphatase family protein [Ktedonobacteraceae bacterium]